MNKEQNFDNPQNQQLNIAGVSVSTLIQARKQWYLDNEYKEFKGELPPFIQLKLDTDLRRDRTVINWLYSR
jgi:hypothetical protein